MPYTNPLSLSSQFLFCGLPLRLDSYRGCGFQCTFCFARIRGGSRRDEQIVPAATGYLRNTFTRVLYQMNHPAGVVAQCLKKRMPIHFGGMSDPFQPAEVKHKVTESFLRTLTDFAYPTVISTRATLISEEPYISILKQMPYVIVQFSLTSTEDHRVTTIEPHSPRASMILRTMETLAREGIIVTCRWQPFIRGCVECPSIYIRRISTAGAKHVSLEHLKIPVETNAMTWQAFVDGAKCKPSEMYRSLNARRDGREFILPPVVKVETILEVAQLAHKHGLTFGAADNDLQYLSDTLCCCSGIDQFSGFENWFKHQIGFAVRQRLGKDITYDAISNEWAPDGSIDRFLNS